MQEKYLQDDPWTAAALPSDRSQNAWMVSYIDILMLLTTLLIVLLAIDKRTPEKRPMEIQAAEVMPRQQTYAHHANPTTFSRSGMWPNGQQSRPGTLPVKRLLQKIPPRLPQVPVPILPHGQEVLQTAAPSVVGRPESTTRIDPGAAEDVTSITERTAESVTKSIPWHPPDDLKEQIEMVRQAEQIRFEVNDAILFESGSAELKARGGLLLARLVDILQRQPGSIWVEGHTDDRPIATAYYPSNWELSAARASTVARHLIRLGIAADRLRTIGYADRRPRNPNTSEAGRARNRRVTLVMYPNQP